MSTCEICGRDVENLRHGVCAYCAKHRTIRGIAKSYLSREWRVVRDALPIEDGGFRPGAIIRTEELLRGLELGSFVPGMKIKSVVDNSRIFEVMQSGVGCILV